MKNLKNVSQFFFREAKYYLGDKRGNRLLVRIDYKNGNYDLAVSKKKNAGITVLASEANKIALDLLKRKSKVNFGENNC